MPRQGAYYGVRAEAVSPDIPVKLNILGQRLADTPDKSNPWAREAWSKLREAAPRPKPMQLPGTRDLGRYALKLRKSEFAPPQKASDCAKATAREPTSLTTSDIGRAPSSPRIARLVAASASGSASFRLSREVAQ